MKRRFIQSESIPCSWDNKCPLNDGLMLQGLAKKVLCPLQRPLLADYIPHWWSHHIANSTHSDPPCQEEVTNGFETPHPNAQPMNFQPRSLSRSEDTILPRSRSTTASPSGGGRDRGTSLVMAMAVYTRIQESCIFFLNLST